MRMFPKLIAVALLLLSLPSYSNTVNIDSSSVFIRLINYDPLLSDSFKIGYQPASYVLMPQYAYVRGITHQPRELIWEIPCAEPVLLDLSSLFGKGFSYVIFEPGDSLILTQSNGTFEILGNAKYKINFIKSYLSGITKILPPEKSELNKFSSIDDYWEIDKYCDKLVSNLQSVCVSSQGHLSKFSFNYLRANLLAEIEYKRLLSFENLAYHRNRSDITNDSLSSIFEKNIKNENFEYLKGYDGPIRNYVYYYFFARLYTFKNHNYKKNDPIILSVKRKVEYYNFAKLNYVGHPLQSCLTALLTHMGLKDYTLKSDGYSSEIDSLLGDFYSMPGYPAHKEYVKNYELKMLSLVAGRDRDTYDFKLKNDNGDDIRRSDFNGKILLLDFWSPASHSSIEINRILSEVAHVFKKDTNFMLVRIAPIIFKGELDPNGAIHKAYYRHVDLYIPEGDSGLHIIKGYNINSFPKLFLLDRNGRSYFDQYNEDSAYFTINDAFPDPRVDNGAKLVEVIKEKIAQLNDGPYVIRQHDSILHIDYMNSNQIHTSSIKDSKSFRLKVATDSYERYFFVSLTDTINVPPTIYTKPTKLFAISDIEGNFNALKKLLLANKVINEDFEWTFNEGHLVVNGDVFDRGKQVTECLWLLYSLEQKARKMGGYVHVILGNHELMNLSGDQRYADSKYQKYASVSGASFENIWGVNSELGRWIRSKNIIEKIGNIVFVHGGISSQLNTMNIPLESINLLFRRFAFESAPGKVSNSDTFHILVDSPESPLWYREYYSTKHNEREIQNIQKTLSMLKASMIVTGHTIVYDTVSVHYDGKLINIDTPHADGKSEGLLIENNRYFRVNSHGLKKELMSDKVALADLHSID